jgi:hypothetical protein
MLESVLIGLGIAVALFAILAVVISLQPTPFRVSRSLTMKANPGKIFPHVNNLHAWASWSPFEKLDPDMKKTYEGPESGVGAKQSWSGNARAGQGSMTITDSQPDSLVQLRLDFEKPFKNTNMAEFTFQPATAGTSVTWTMTGKRNFMSKAFGLIVSMDKMLGGFFEEGLNNLKAISEA